MTDYNEDGFPSMPIMERVSVSLQRDGTSGWEYGYEHTGGGIMCITAHPDHVQGDDTFPLYIGTADVVWGWSDLYGDVHGDIGDTTDQRESIGGVSSACVDVERIARAIRYTVESWKI